MTSDVLDFPGITTLDLDPDRILEGAKGQLESVVVIGFDHEGMEYFASSKADGGHSLWLLERFKLQLLRQADLEE